MPHWLFFPLALPSVCCSLLALDPIVSGLLAAIIALSSGGSIPMFFKTMTEEAFLLDDGAGGARVGGGGLGPQPKIP